MSNARRMHVTLMRVITGRHCIGIGLQQKIGESVSVENDVLGLTLIIITVSTTTPSMTATAPR